MDPELALIALSRACILAQRGSRPRERIVCKRVEDRWKGVAHSGPLGEVSASYKDDSVLVSAGSERQSFRVEHPQRVAVTRGSDGEIALVEVLDEAWVVRLAGVAVQLHECDALPFTVFDDPVRLFVFRSGGECILFERRTLVPDVDGALAWIDEQARKPRAPVIRCMTQNEALMYNLLMRMVIGPWTIIDYVGYHGALVAFDDGILRGAWGYVPQKLIPTLLIVVCDGRKLTVNGAGRATPCADQTPEAAKVRVWRGVVIGVE